MEITAKWPPKTSPKVAKLTVFSAFSVINQLYYINKLPTAADTSKTIKTHSQ